MTQAAQIMTDAYAKLQQGDPLGAERILAAVWNATTNPPADARHLLGLIRREQGRIQEAEVLLRSAIDADPKRAEFHNSLGVTLRAAGFPREAEAAYREAEARDAKYWQARLNRARVLVELDRAGDAVRLVEAVLKDQPRSAIGWTVLAAARRVQQSWPAALEAARQALALDPQSFEARDHLAVALAKRGEWAAAGAEFQILLNGPGRADALVSWGAVLAEAGRADEAQARFEEALTAAPTSVRAHEALAQLRWMRGDKGGFLARANEALRANPLDLTLRLKIADLLNRSDRAGDALALLRSAPATPAGQAALDAALAVLEWQVGDRARAVTLAEQAVKTAPFVEPFRKTAVAAQVIGGDPKAAVAHADWGMTRSPEDQEWIALSATARRKAGDPSYRALYDYDRFVGVYDLAAPQGFPTMAAFNERLAARLREMHVYAAHPLDQSLRGGTQTPVSLLDSEDPLIRAFLAALDAPIRAHMAKIGAGKGHPLTERNTGAYRFRGCWSVRLTQGGSHVNHVHPEGWLSSAYYVTTPPDVENTAAKTGWLTFGEPRFREAGLAPEHFVQPRPGRLALFPSYMWHGVAPFTTGAERMTIAFDVVPA